MEGHEWVACTSRMGVEVKHLVKYLAMWVGNVVEHEGIYGLGFTEDWAFAPALQEAFRRAKIVSTLRHALKERFFMLRSWILPVVSWVVSK